MPDKPDEVPSEVVVEQKDEPIHFSLRREPWIPIVRPDGTRGEVGLEQVLAQAHLLREVSDPLPPIECGLLRLLVAFALDIFEPRDARDWKDVWQQGRFDEGRVRKYLDEHDERLDLFSADYPFLQSTGMVGESTTVARLAPEHPTGLNATHFNHRHEDDLAVSPQIAARMLTVSSPFAMYEARSPGGGYLLRSINGTDKSGRAPWYVLLRGHNLFETLWLNCCALEELLPLAQGDAPPIWRNAPDVVFDVDSSPISQRQALTWQPRRVLLIPSGPGECSSSGQLAPNLIRRIKLAPGSKAPGQWRDPNVAYRIRPNSTRPLCPEESRQLWRDTGALLLLTEREFVSEKGDTRFERPAVVSQFAYLYSQGVLGPKTPFNCIAYGIRSHRDQMKHFEWHREALSLPAPLVLDRRFHMEAQGQMRLAEDVAYALAASIKKAYPREGAGNDRAFESLIARAQTGFWRRLRPLYTDAPDSFLFRIADMEPARDGEKIEAEVKRWREGVRRVALQVLEGAIDDLDSDGGAIKRAVEARRHFQTRLWALFNPEAAAQARAKSKKAKAKGEA